MSAPLSGASPPPRTRQPIRPGATARPDCSNASWGKRESSRSPRTKCLFAAQPEPEENCDIESRQTFGNNLKNVGHKKSFKAKEVLTHKMTKEYCQIVEDSMAKKNLIALFFKLVAVSNGPWKVTFLFSMLCQCVLVCVSVCVFMPGGRHCLFACYSSESWYTSVPDSACFPVTLYI